MTRVIGDISVSIDGFVTGPDPAPDLGLGRDGEALHAWALVSDHPVDRQVLARSTVESGAVVMGRTLFDVIDGPQGWDDQMGYGADQVGRPAFVVVTSDPPASVRLGLDFTFVDTPAAAVERARAAAGDKDVVVMGGARTVRSCLEAGLLDELRLHVAPEVMGAGTPLFADSGRHRLEQRQVEVSPHAVHVTYAVRPAT
ncbi:dihydrofolate reductase family protein [Nocardioides sp. SYSU D00038]|uniref:dihydrofolate reductase family protein n=1 Tax=Nocardioides sp. SYSU D00038 TaxID=2812554 RepID=UPI0019689798|nr:dihydrofolate reductase family protein [Nocardioides sp. SYSU D00038]